MQQAKQNWMQKMDTMEVDAKVYTEQDAKPNAKT